MKLLYSQFLSLAALAAAAADDDEATFGAVDPAGTKNNLRRASADKKTYVVGFTEKVTGPAARCNALANAASGSALKTYEYVLNGGCALELTEGAAKALRQNSEVAFVEEDGVATAFYSWGLDRVDQCDLPLVNPGLSPLDAAGTRVFILDTGIKRSHNLITLSTSGCHTSFISGQPADSDGNGHGTHVANTACGAAYGVATNCELCAVKVLSDAGSGSTSGVIAGVDYVAQNCNGKCVANMSLGGGFYAPLNTAVNDAVAVGATFVVAAGNSNANSCNYSPAAAANAITVGSTTSSDARSSFSNYGTCVDIFAPGSGITAAWIYDNTSTRTISGTSMASPHVAGLAAGILGSGTASTPAGVLAELLNVAAAGKVGDPGPNSPNLLAVTPTACGPAGPPPSHTPVTCSNYDWRSCPSSSCDLVKQGPIKCCVPNGVKTCP